MNEKKKGLGLVALIAIATGSTIGSAVVTLIGQAIGVTGKSAWLAYMAAIAVGLFLVIPYALLSSQMRVNGGNYTLVSVALGDYWGGVIGVTSILNVFSMAMFGTSIGIYINSLVPSVQPKIGGMIAITAFFVLNLYGVKSMSKIQNILSVILIGGLGLFIVMGLPKLQPGLLDFADPEYFSGGIDGFSAAVMLLFMSATGQRFLIAFSKDAENPKRNLPLAMFATTLIILFIYTGVAIVNCGILPIDDVKGQPLTVIASHIMPGALYYFFIIGGPIMALATTLNGSFAIAANPLQQAAKDGWLPMGLAKTNKNGVSYIIYVILYVCSVIPLLFDINIAVLASTAVLGISVAEIIILAAILVLPNKVPEAWEKRYYKIPRTLYRVFIVLAILLQAYMLSISLKNTTVLLAGITVVLFIIFFLNAYIRRKSGKVKIEKSYEI